MCKHGTGKAVGHLRPRQKKHNGGSVLSHERDYEALHAKRDINGTSVEFINIIVHSNRQRLVLCGGKPGKCRGQRLTAALQFVGQWCD